MSTIVGERRRSLNPTNPDTRDPQPHNRCAWSVTHGTGSWQLPDYCPQLPHAVSYTPEAWITGLTIAMQLASGGRDSIQVPDGKGTSKPISIAKVLAVAHIDAATADYRTGQGVATAHATVAHRIGHKTSPRTVRRARLAIEMLGYAHVTVEGRYLSPTEQDQANAAHPGSVQRRVASTRVLLIPTVIPTDIEIWTPTRQGDVQLLGFVSSVVTNAHRARSSASRTTRTSTDTHRIDRPRPTRHPKNRTKKPLTSAPAAAQPRHHTQRPSLATQRLAAGLALHCPWLAPTTSHIGRLCRALDTTGIHAADWTAQQLCDALTAHHKATRGGDTLPPDQQRNPLATLVAQLRAMLPTITETPTQRHRRERAARAEHDAAERAARAERDAQAADRAAQAAAAQAARAIVRPDEPAGIHVLDQERRRVAIARAEADAHHRAHHAAQLAQLDADLTSHTSPDAIAARATVRRIGGAAAARAAIHATHAHAA